MRAGKVRLIPPARSALLVPRGRLSDRVDAIGLAKIAMVQAPAGYGKTTLLTQWFKLLVDQGHVAVWVSIEPTLGHPLDLYASLTDALEMSGIAADEVRALLSAEGFAAAGIISAAISDALAAHEGHIFIFLDDLHFLLNDGGRESLAHLLEYLPANAHLVMASREAPDLPLGRLRARGELIEVFAHDLRFAEEEVATFLARAGQADLSESDITDISASTEGWAAGLRLLSLALADGDRASVLGSKRRGRPRFGAFFSEEVFSRRSPEIQNFLLATACVSRFCASLADVLTGDASGTQRLAEIENAGLFLVPLDDDGEWYRYHHLFGEFLQRRLADHDPDAMARICKRASDWFAEHGLLSEAFDHAMRANDPESAAAVLDRWSQSMFYNGELRLFTGLAEQLPAASLAKFPFILFTQAWLLIISWRFAEAAEVLAISRERLKALGTRGAAGAECMLLQFLQAHRDMMLALFTDRMIETGGYLESLAAMEAPPDHYIRASIYTARIYHGHQRLKPCDVADLDAQWQPHARRSGSIFIRIWHYSAVALALIRSADIHRARSALMEAMASARRLGGEISDLAAIPALLLAGLVYELDDRAEAARLISTYEELGRDLGYVDQRISCLLVAIRLRQLNKDYQSVEWLLGDAAALASAHGFERLRLAVAAEAARHYLLTGRPDQAWRFVRKGDISANLRDHWPTQQSVLIDETRALLAVRLAQTRGEFADAATASRRWSQALLQAGWRLPGVRWAILAASLEAMNGDRSQAQRTLLAAALIGQDCGLIRSFLDGGEIVMSLLCGRGDADSAIDGYLQELAKRWDAEQGNLPAVNTEAMRHFGESDLVSALEALTEKEVEILRRVAGGQMNREVAAAIGLTEGSIKWYLNRIYGKIGVSRRTQAVKRARQLGLIV